MQEQDTVLAVLADMHVGSTLAVSPLKWNLDDGNTHRASPGQRIMHRQWVKSAKEVNALRNEGPERKRLVIIVNGDPMDGDHHKTPQLITKRPSEQIAMAADLLDEWMGQAEFSQAHGDLMYLIRGTTAHEEGEHINTLGRDLDGVVPFRKDSSPNHEDGRYYHEKLRLKINGLLFDITHHGFGRGSRRWYETNYIRYTMASMYYEFLEERMPIPDYVIRSHLHYYLHDTYKQMWGCITPCWKLKDNFIYKVGANSHINTIGMVYFDVLASGHSKAYAEYIKVKDVDIKEI